MGSLGFMTPFGISHMEAVLNGVTGLERGVPLMLRHRLQVCAGRPVGQGRRGSCRAGGLVGTRTGSLGNNKSRVA